MKSVVFSLLFSLCFGCSTQTTVDQVATISTPVPAATTSVPDQTLPNVPTNTGSTYTANGIEAKIGVVTRTDADLGCLKILNATLKASDEFYAVVPYEKPHEIHKLRIREKLAKSCVDNSSDMEDSDRVNSRSSYYLAELVAEDDETILISGVAVVGVSKAPTLEKGIATAELTGAPPAEYFRECTGNESMAFTVWTGRPLIGKRIWQRYIYLRYDTVPTCKKKDYQGTNE